MRPTQSFSTSISVSWSTNGTLHVVYPRVLVAAIHVHVYCQHPFIHLDKLVKQIETSIFLKRKQCNGKAWAQIPSMRCPYLSNTLTNNLCSALLNFSFFCFVLYCCAFVQYCNVKTILHTISCINLLVYWTTSRSQLLCHYTFTFGHLLLEAQTF